MDKETPPRASRALPERPNLEHLRNEAKGRLKLLHLTNPAARLAIAQRDVARDYGFSSWRRLAAQLRFTAEGSPGLPYEWGDDLSRATAEAIERGDLDAAERVYRDLIARNPPGVAEIEADFALFLLRERRNPDAARAIFERLMRRPTATLLAKYATFAGEIGDADIDRREDILRRAAALGDDVLAFNNLACFLWYERGNRAEAERWFRQAAESECGYAAVDAASRGIYAELLWQWGDPVMAETWFRLARLKSPDAVPIQTNVTFAAMLTVLGRVDEGLAMIPEILCQARGPALSERPARWYELAAWFLRYAHGDNEMRRAALTEIRTRLTDWRPMGGCTLDLARNARAAAVRGHPAADLVAAFAALLTIEPEGAETARAELENCSTWREI